ncbi:hypothetical protein PX458_000041 [Staphylococcus pseudintermedius]|uniref:Uncharacterized protein n=1 Tax=Staphylococcus pseudintermedius TaxID=283734 RepID=A0A7T7NWJ9_STAPS|nr:hypothetical protein [Staphylococcus pseudintermedius]ASQ50597.1 hypothetical protein SPS5912_06345 [Staphylococcus pseudintermedius]EGQ0289775.1 hypothetical protein [Staphylococcus pseudintermedius]EGQ0294045.1 hypothetical protein [Staphylococcus pseudintermedius]EGQ0306761.1 hypothetical protein [Staphylococcus pseudintermedius]EGQ0316144.1 hypothetical protein [Staphylococcus pseudintermedius]
MIYKIYAGKYEYFKPSSLEEVEFDLKKIIEFKQYDMLEVLLKDIESLKANDFELFEKYEIYDLMLEKGLFVDKQRLI